MRVEIGLVLTVLAGVTAGCGDDGGGGSPDAGDAVDAGPPDAALEALLVDPYPSSLAIAGGDDYSIVGAAVADRGIDEIALLLDGVVVHDDPGVLTLWSTDFDGSALSEQAIGAIADFELRVASRESMRIGIVDADGEMIHGLVLHNTGFFETLEGGPFERFATGDAFGIRVAGATVEYYRNGATVATVAASTSSRPWQIRAELQSSGAIFDATIQDGGSPAEPVTWIDLVHTRETAGIWYRWDTELFADGDNTLTVRVTDATGASATTEPFPITVDNTLPVCTELLPGDGSTVSGTVDLDATFVESHPAIITFFVDGQPYSEHLGGPLQATSPWDTTGVANGSHVILAAGYDMAGNIGECSATVTVANP